MAQRDDDRDRRTPAPRRTDGRIPPHNLHAEESLLGALLLSRDVVGVVAELGLSVDHFYKPAHQHIYASVRGLMSTGQPVDIVTVADELRRNGLLDEIGGAQFLLDLQNATPAISNASRYAKIVQDTAVLRRMISVASEIAELAYQEPDDVTKALDEAETKVFEVAEDRVVDSTKPLADLLPLAMDKLQETFDRGDTITGVATGFNDLDEIMAGLQPSTLNIIGARPAMGKCVAWDTPMVNPTTGEVRTAEEWYLAGSRGERVGCLTLDDQGRTITGSFAGFYNDGVKPLFRVTTRSGRTIRITAEHPLLTGRGWQPLSDITVGTRVAVPTCALDGSSIGDARVPLEVWDDVIKAKGELSWAEISRRAGKPASHNWHPYRRRPRRDTIGRLAEVLDCDVLRRWASPDVSWDEITSIEACGEDRIYDFNVPGTHNFVAADFFVHNTAFGLGIATHIAMTAKKPVLFFSLEMGHAELTQRILSSEARVDSQKLRTGRLVDSDWTKIGRAINRLEVPLFLDDNPRVTVMEIRAKARRMKSRYGGLALIVIDYLQLMSGGQSTENRQLEVSEISRGLKILARELDTPVIALSQLSRNLETRGDKRPMLADLRESGSLEQDADVVMFLYRDEVYNRESPDKGSAEVIIAKHRAGPTGVVRLVFNGAYTRFDNAAKGLN
jgi:replicative DNA helicase